MSEQYSGSIRLYIGCMWSGKTSAVIEAYNRHVIGRRKCLLVKYTNDTRYSDNGVITHSGIIKETNIKCQYLYEIDHIVRNYDVVCIDEIQFYKDAAIFCDLWANDGLIIEAGGLSGTFQRKDFKVISDLIPKAELIIWKMAVCCETGKDAVFTLRTTSEKSMEVIGGIDKYKAVDRKTYFSSITSDDLKEYKMEEMKKFLDIFNDVHKLGFNNDDKNSIIASYLQSQKSSYIDHIINYLEKNKLIEKDNSIYDLINVNKFGSV